MMKEQEQREGFTFFRTYLNAAEADQTMTDAERLAMYRAIAFFALDGREPDTSTFTKMGAILWNMIRPSIKSGFTRFANGCKGAEFGVLGGAPKGNKNAAKKQPKQGKTTPKTTHNDSGGNPVVNNGIGDICKQGKTTPKTTRNENENENEECKNISLSLTPSREVVREVGGVTAAEKERFFEIFFFRNFVNPEQEVERFVDFYSATGWRRHGDVRVVSDRVALARQWSPKDPERSCGRFPQEFLRAFEIAYAEIRAENADDARTIIHGIHKVEISVDKTRICCAKGIPPVFERYAAILNAANVSLGRQLVYAQLRN